MADPFGGIVITIAQQIRCTNCVHHYEGPHGLFCGLWREEIMYDEVALECEDFERDSI